MDRLRQQLSFIMEADRMKTILRRTLISDKSRRENDAEHSWHIALMAMLLGEYAAPGVNPFRVLQMLLVHDLVELYAGDTFAYDEAGKATQAARERHAADRLFSQLPDDQNHEIRGLWEEFDEMVTPDARFAAAMDRLQPFLNNLLTEGHTWVEGHVSAEMVESRMGMIREVIPEVWPFVEEGIEVAKEKGYILEASV